MGGAGAAIQIAEGSAAVGELKTYIVMQLL
jgi:hypothetical protein